MLVLSLAPFILSIIQSSSRAGLVLVLVLILFGASTNVNFGTGINASIGFVRPAGVGAPQSNLLLGAASLATNDCHASSS